MELKTDRQVTLIVNSFRRVFDTGDMNQLTKQAYDFIYLSSGFIAHYNLYGFRNFYSESGGVDTLIQDILINCPINQWNNFGPKDKDYAYMMQKKNIYNQIADLARRHICELV